jgi:hypothetical protein
MVADIEKVDALASQKQEVHYLLHIVMLQKSMKHTWWLNKIDKTTII